MKVLNFGGEHYELKTATETEGIQAFDAGLELDNNPYEESTSKHDAWDDGWSRAKKDYNSVTVGEEGKQ